MEEDDVRPAMKKVVLRGMARAWLLDGQDQAPEQLVDGVADCITAMAGTRSIKSGYYSEYYPSSVEAAEKREDDCREGKEEGRVVGFFLYCEELQPGFLARVNGGMEDGRLCPGLAGEGGMHGLSPAVGHGRRWAC